MADGLDLANVSTTPNRVNVQLQPGTDFNLNGLRYNKLSVSGVPYGFVANSPEQEADIDISQYIFDPTATTSDKVQVEIEGGTAYTVTVSAAAKALIDDGKAEITGVAGVWTPADAPNVNIFYDFSEGTTGASVGGFSDVLGNSTVSQAASVPLPNFGTYGIQFTGAGAIQISGGFGAESYIFVVIAQTDVAGEMQLAGVLGTGLQQAFLDSSGDAIQPGVSTTVNNVLWANSVDANGDAEIETNNGYLGTAGTPFPTLTPTIVGFRRFGTSGGNAVSTIGGAGGASDGRAFDGEIMAWVEINGIPDTATLNNLMGWGIWKIKNAGLTPGQDLPSNHPYFAAPPGTGSAPTVTVVAPSLTITFSNIPDTWEGRAHQGSQVLKHEQSITGGTFTFNPSPGEPVTYTFTQPGFLTQRFVRSITADQEIVIDIIPDPSYEA